MKIKQLLPRNLLTKRRSASSNASTVTVIRNVALIGASGSLGEKALNALVSSGNFNVTVLKRESSSATFPDSVKVTNVDLSSAESVTAALQGQDAVVSTVGTPGIQSQAILIDAAVAAGVKRFLPSDYGCDLDNPRTSALPVYKQKILIHQKLREAAAAKADFTYTLVCNNAFLDWGLQKSILLNWRESKPKLFDGGNTVFSTTTLDTVGQAIVGVLSHPEETRNRFVYVKDIDLTQNKLLEIVKKIDPEKKWEEPIIISTADMEKQSNESLAKGQITPLVMMAYILRVLFGPPEYGGHFTKVDNELLGIEGKTEADVEALLRSLISN
ncbi:hypothetical protein F5884DRAFT_754127 [Xylogone sp. PMI_703]|nr:hypothetical protein F5884DRAFT_754127 [Xylogone sp. PMI_703]